MIGRRAQGFDGRIPFLLPGLLFLLLVFAAPMAGVLWQSVIPAVGSHTPFSNFAKILSTSLFVRVAVTTLTVSVTATGAAMVLAYPVAYFLAQQTPARRSLWIILVLVPFWTSTLVKSFAFTVILGQGGVVNDLLRDLGLGPVKLLFNRTGVIIGLSQALTPFMVFPILTNLLGQPVHLRRAASILGASKLTIFRRVTLPLSLPGVVAGVLLCFIISLGSYAYPALLGGREDIMLGNLIDFYARELLNWPLASTLGILLTAIAIAATLVLSRLRSGSGLVGQDAP